MERLQEAESGLKMKLYSWPEEHGAGAEADSSEEQCSLRVHAVAIGGDMMSPLPPLDPHGRTD